jgi:hypothetical protein
MKKVTRHSGGLCENNKYPLKYSARATQGYFKQGNRTVSNLKITQSFQHRATTV